VIPPKTPKPLLP